MSPTIWIDSTGYPDATENLRPWATLVRPEAGRPWDEQLAGADGAVITARYPFDAALFARMPRLRVVARLGVGYDNVDVPAATAAGVCVGYTPNASNDSVAELVFALALALLRHVRAGDACVREGQWARRDGMSGPELRGKTLGVIGLGRIGTRAAEVAHFGFGMRVLAYDPYLAPQQFTARHAERATTLEELLRQADVVTLHIPANPETRHLINAGTLSLMKPGALLINTARGAVVDEAALAEALSEHRLAGAGLDVFEREPLPDDSPLCGMPNVVLMPHLGGLSEESVRNIGQLAASAVFSVLHDTQPTNLVNPEVWPTRRR